MKHHAASRYRALYQALPDEIRQLADKNFALLKSDPRHPSLRLKRVGAFWSARIGQHYRVLGTDVEDGITWFLIGTHAEYDRLIG